MKHKFFARLGAALLAAVLLLGALASPLAPLPAAVAVEGEGLSVTFAGNYAKVGQPMTLKVENAASSAITYSWAVDGKTVGTGSSSAPTENDLMKWISVTVQCGGDTAEARMFFSELPVVYINTEGGAPIVSKENYIDAELIIQGNETYNSKTT